MNLNSLGLVKAPCGSINELSFICSVDCYDKEDCHCGRNFLTEIVGFKPSDNGRLEP